MIALDSSGWIEVFTAGPRAAAFRKWTDEAHVIVVPTVVMYEVYKVIRRRRSEMEAVVAAARLRECHLVPLDDRIALEAADLSLQHGLAMADAVVYATALIHDAPLITADADLKDLPGVEYIASGGD